MGWREDGSSKGSPKGEASPSSQETIRPSGSILYNGFGRCVLINAEETLTRPMVDISMARACGNSMPAAVPKCRDALQKVAMDPLARVSAARTQGGLPAVESDRSCLRI